MSEDVIVVGAGGFGREVIDVIEAVNAVSTSPKWHVVGVVDDAPSGENLQRLAQRSIGYLGDIATVINSGKRPLYVLGVGNPRVRRLLANRFDDAGFSAADALMHPSATVGSSVGLGAGTVVCAGVRLTTNIAVGTHVHLNLNVTVGHDTTLGDFVSINPLASISGDCTIDDDALIGVGASLINGLSVGTGAVVGGGACAIRNVPAGVTVVGVPAVPLIPREES